MLNTNVSQRVKNDALRGAGLRPVKMWVLDTKRAGVAEECRRQSLLLKNDSHEQETTQWLESVADCDGWQ